MTRIFITGATGYIGGEVLSKLILIPQLQIYALVRTQSQVSLIQNGTNGKVHPVLGDLDSDDVLSQQTMASDIIINTASNNHIPSLKVFKYTLSQKKTPTLFLHVSGAAVVADSTDPNFYTPDKVYSDIKDIEEINSLSDSQPHRIADKLVLSMENDSFVKTAIISPSTIFGKGNGLGNQLSVQIPGLVKAAQTKGYLGLVNNGETRWGHVHVSDVAQLFVLIITKFISNDDFPSGYYGYYFAQYGSDHTWKQVTLQIVSLLYEKRIIASKQVTEMTAKEFEATFNLPALFWGSNCRTVADNAFSIGWEPSLSNDHHFYGDIEDTVEFMVRPKTYRTTWMKSDASYLGIMIFFVFLFFIVHLSR